MGEEDAHLGGDPVLAHWHRGLEHALRPGRDVARAVVGVALEDQLARALLAGLESAEGHAVGQTVHHLEDKKEKEKEKAKALDTSNYVFNFSVW